MARCPRAAHRRALLALLAAAVVVATCVPAAVAVRAEQRVDEQTRRAAGLLDAAQRGVRVTTNSADDAAAHQSAASAALAALLGPHEVIRTRMTYPLDAHTADDPAGPARPVVLAHVADWADRVDLVQGRAPQAGDVVEVVAPVAAGLATGERLLVGDTGLPVLVVGTWRPRDPADPLWFADLSLSRGTLSDRNDAVGPLFTAARARATMTAALVALLGIGAALAAWRLTRMPGAPDTVAHRPNHCCRSS